MDWRGCLLELQGGDLAGEAGDEEGHLPGADVVTCGLCGAALGLAIVLAQAADGVRGGADVEAGEADGGAQEVAAVEGGDGTVERHGRWWWCVRLGR